jgi:7-carboxy-7-deazaguanine synthase
LNATAQSHAVRARTGNAARTNSLLIAEVFYSIQGEALDVGRPSVFIRLSGCPLRCRYCDTTYAFTGGAWHSIEHLLDKVARFGTRHVCVTGGEPLAQTRCLTLLERLAEAGYCVSLETSGALDISKVDPRVRRIVDVKTPASAECERNLLSNLALLQANDALKFVICDRADYEWARAFLDGRDEIEDSGCRVYFSPSYGEVDAGELADWILADRLNVSLQIQLHKVLWGDVPGR